jgi:leucyl-tRNA synthetase
VIERKYQKLWHDNRPFESDAPSLQEYPASISTEELHEKVPKYFATMAYPYV